MPGDAHPVVKIGLIAPFEGVGRPVGYAMLPVVKAALAEANASGQLGRYRVALAAFNDDLNPRGAAAQARALTQDAEIVAVLGPWEAATIQAAAPILAQAGIPMLAAEVISAQRGDDAATGSEQTLARAAAVADANARVLLRALGADIAAHGRPSRVGMTAALTQPR
jgi:ABC-type branched-subunit amino acid transport system substrate-binding protein